MEVKEIEATDSQFCTRLANFIVMLYLNNMCDPYLSISYLPWIMVKYMYN